MTPASDLSERSVAAPAPGCAPTVAGLLSSTTDLLRRAGVESPRRDARILVGHATGLDDAAIGGRPESPVSPSAVASLERITDRRASGEPLSRVLGRREFWSLPFRLSADTLDPRPDSETLVDAVLGRLADRRAALRILDLGTGSGCLLLALLHELPNAFGVGVDLSPGACSVAAANARALELADRVGFIASDWSSPILGRFDAVVANPPYIPAGQIATLPREVRSFDPWRALSGGDDGLAAYRAIAADLGTLLRPGGFAALEVGAGQAAEVTRILAGAQLAVRSRHRDLAGIERCLVTEAANP